MSSPPATFETFHEVLPEMPEKEAKVEVSQAIAYAAANHTKRFLRREPR